MLLKTQISNADMSTDEWLNERLGKFTASEIHHLMGEKFPTKGAKSYIYRKVGEYLSGMPSRDTVDTPATMHGNLYEIEALKAFCREKKIELVVTQKLIYGINLRHACTPDGLIPLTESPDKTSYTVATVETKCPQPENFIWLAECNTPEEIKALNPNYYWQVLFQIHVCGALNGYLAIYQPYFKANGLKIIEFRKMLLLKDFTFLNQRLIEAESLFNTIKSKYE